MLRRAGIVLRVGDGEFSVGRKSEPVDIRSWYYTDSLHDAASTGLYMGLGQGAQNPLDGFSND